MQTKILKGMPFLVDAATKRIYAYEKNGTQTSQTTQSTQPLLLGSYDPEKGTYELHADWQESFAPKLQEHRANTKPLSRLPNATPAVK